MSQLTSPVNYVEPFWGSGANWLCHPRWGKKRPFPVPYFGGKERAAEIIWSRFGCDELPKVATANDVNGFVANAMRAMAADPDGVARWCDWPVSEVDLHARHRWLLKVAGKLRARLEADPFYYDIRIAGWWIWGASQWTGSGWCEEGKPPTVKLPTLNGGGGAGASSQRGTLNASMRGPSRRLPDLAGGTQWGSEEPNTRAGKGIHGAGMRGPSRKIPNLGGSSSGGEPVVNHGAGIHGATMQGPSRQLPAIGSKAPTGQTRNAVGTGVFGDGVRTRLHDVFSELQRRLRAWAHNVFVDWETLARVPHSIGLIAAIGVLAYQGRR